MRKRWVGPGGGSDGGSRSAARRRGLREPVSGSAGPGVARFAPAASGRIPPGAVEDVPSREAVDVAAPGSRLRRLVSVGPVSFAMVRQRWRLLDRGGASWWAVCLVARDGSSGVVVGACPG